MNGQAHQIWSSLVSSVHMFRYACLHRPATFAHPAVTLSSTVEHIEIYSLVTVDQTPSLQHARRFIHL